MATDSTSGLVAFDRRQIYRPFLERLNPIASARGLFERDLIVPRDRDPRYADQLPIHMAFANSAELTRGMQMALVGGIGSGKTTELLLTQKVLSRHADAVNIYLDLADYTDLSEINSGSILAAAGMRLYGQLRNTGEGSQKRDWAYAKLTELAFGTTKWFEPTDPDPWAPEGNDQLIPVDIPGLMKRRFPPLRSEVREVKDLLLAMASPLLEKDAQITLLIDGLDRLIEPDLFREFVEQDLQALRGTKITVIIAAPLLLSFDKSRFLQDYFDSVKYIPTAAAGPEDSAFLRQILERRGAPELMKPAEISSVVKYSGGVLRDLLSLARSAAEYAYHDDEDRISRRHVNIAIKQLGNRYLAGLGKTQMTLLHRLTKNEEFPVDDPTARELLVNRQVLEYFRNGREFFAVHPALASVMPKSE